MNVVSLMPLAVEALPAPININNKVNTIVPSLMLPKSRELKPAVLGVTA